MPEPDALSNLNDEPARPWLALVGASAHELAVLEEALCLLGTFSPSGPELRTVAPGRSPWAPASWWDAGSSPALRGARDRHRWEPSL